MMVKKEYDHLLPMTLAASRGITLDSRCANSIGEMNGALTRRSRDVSQLDWHSVAGTTLH
jgi:hypothetical protein